MVASCIEVVAVAVAVAVRQCLQYEVPLEVHISVEDSRLDLLNYSKKTLLFPP